jgi:hypothetical protein
MTSGFDAILAIKASAATAARSMRVPFEEALTYA